MQNQKSMLLISKKILIAISGIILFSFIIVHLCGNLLVFLGKEYINTYAAMLHEKAGLLVFFRIIMIISLCTHVFLSVQLEISNKFKKQNLSLNIVKATLGSRTMIYTGVCIFLFIVYHLLHLTLDCINADLIAFTINNQKDVYLTLINSFSNTKIAFFYVLFISALGLHLSHAIFSFFQTLGITSLFFKTSMYLKFSLILSICIVIGYISIPVFIYLGIIA